MIEVLKTDVFSEWVEELKDCSVQARILERINRIKLGNFGDYKALGGGLFELRLDFGPGYRMYYVRKGSLIILLLCGGDKSTQKKDIAKAKKIMKEQ